MARLSLSPPRAPRAPLSYPPNGLRAFPCQTCLCKPQKKKKQGFIPPANPTEVEHSHVFVFNNIFFSYAADSPDAYKAVSGEAAARKSASQVYTCVAVSHL